MDKNKKNNSVQNDTKPAWIKFLAIVVAALIGGAVTLMIETPEFFKRYPKPNEELIVRMYNTDDIAEIYVNDSLIEIFEATENNTLYRENIIKELKTGDNEIKYIIKNLQGGWAFSFELIKDGYIYYSRTKYKYRGETIGKLRQNKLVEHHGALNDNKTLGIVFRDSIIITK
jgi:hypothetical protein